MLEETAKAPTLDEKVADFLSQSRIAVVGVSTKKPTPANSIYRKLKDDGKTVIPINPGLQSYEGDPCYPDLSSIPVAVDGVVIVTRPEITEEIVRQCVAARIPRVWMHQSLASAGTSVSKEAVETCERNGIQVIAGACPMMFCQPVDFAHRCFRMILGATGGLPK